MSRLKKSPFYIFIYGTFAAVLLVVLGLLFMNSPQCPIEYTQEQVNASGCIIGANIGLGLVFLLAVGVWIAATVIAIVLALSKKSKKTPE